VSEDRDRLNAALERAMREQRLDSWHREAALGLLEAPPAEWPPCCGSACEPCTLVLRRVVERAQALLASER
jgi:hypothetical protein